MAHVHQETTIQARAERVWGLAGDPGRIAEWLPTLATSELEGDIRRCTLVDGGELRERILEHSDTERAYSYEITDSPLPVRAYRSRLSIEAQDDHSHVVWEVDFEPEDPRHSDEVTSMLDQLYGQGLATLRHQLEHEQTA